MSVHPKPEKGRQSTSSVKEVSFNRNFLVTLWLWVSILVHFLQYRVSCILETVLPVKVLRFILRFDIDM